MNCIHILSTMQQIRPVYRQASQLYYCHHSKNLQEIWGNAGIMQSISTSYGAPELFITFMANSTWPEILSNLKNCEKLSDWLDWVVRVFKLKLKYFMDDLKKYGVLVKWAIFQVISFIPVFNVQKLADFNVVIAGIQGIHNNVVQE